MAKVTIDDVLESIDSWTVLDLNNLRKGIEDKYGVSAAAPAGGVRPGTVVTATSRIGVS